MGRAYLVLGDAVDSVTVGRVSTNEVKWARLLNYHLYDDLQVVS